MASGTQTICTQTSQFNSNVVVYNGQGAAGAAGLNTQSTIDYKVTDDHFLTGGDLLVQNGNAGDTINMQVIDKDGVGKGVQMLGMPTGFTYDMLPTYPVIRQFVTNRFINPQSVLQKEFDLPYPARIIAGFYLRNIYTSTGGMMAPWIATNYDLHMILR